MEQQMNVLMQPKPAIINKPKNKLSDEDEKRKQMIYAKIRRGELKKCPECKKWREVIMNNGPKSVIIRCEHCGGDYEIERYGDKWIR